MAGIMNKISETLHMGGNKEEAKKADEHKGPEGYHVVEGHKASEGYHGGEEHKKEGMVEKIKDKIHGGDHEGSGGEKKKKKEKKGKKDKKEKEHGGGHSSSSDSDSD